MRLIDADALIQKRAQAKNYEPDMYVIGQGYVMDAPTITTHKDESNDGCEYCREGKPFYVGTKNSQMREIYIEQDGTLSFSYWFGEDGIGDNFKIKCCPNCGRRLHNDTER